MKPRWRKFPLLVGLVAIGILATGLPASQEEPAIGSPAPDFKLPDLNGMTHELSQFQGKIVVLEWTNPGCPVVQRHYASGLMPAIQKELTAKGIAWLAVNSTNPNHRDYKTADALKQIYAGWKAAYTSLLLDPEGKAGKAFGAKTTPHMFVIDKNRRLVYDGAIDDDPRGENATRTNYVRQAVESLLKGEPVPIARTKPYGCSVKYAE